MTLKHNFFKLEMHAFQPAYCPKYVLLYRKRFCHTIYHPRFEIRYEPRGSVGFICWISVVRDFLYLSHILFIILIMITICGKSRSESRELSTSVPCILILLISLSHILYNPVSLVRKN